MSKRIYPVTVENGELVESSEKLTVNGLPISKNGTIDASNVSGSSSEWTVDANGNLVPKDGEPVQVGSLSSDDQSINNAGGLDYAGHTVGAILEAESSGLREEHGTVTLNPGGASDDSWGTYADDTVSVSFSSAFSSAPTVYATSISQTNVLIAGRNISTTGFDYVCRNFRSADVSASDYAWLAIGPE